jgi:hypothetical protein
MTTRQFNRYIDFQIERCKRLLVLKGREYTPDVDPEAEIGDRLGHFRESGVSQDCPSEQALWGMLDKHLRSLMKMCKEPTSFLPEIWDEKLTDALNYLLILSAMVNENTCAHAPGQISWEEL